MINYNEILKENPNGVLATQNGTLVSTRILQCLFVQGNKVFFCTDVQKQLYVQLTANPNVSFCTHTKNFMPVLSVNGKAVFSEDAGVKARILDENTIIKNTYKTSDNPNFKIFYIDADEVKTYSFSEGSKSYKI